MPYLLRCFVVLLALSLTSSLNATTIVPFSDADLVDKSPVVLLGQIVGQLPDTTERAVTDWLVVVERVLKGPVPASAITIRVPGGETSTGEVLVIHGAPKFRDGEEVLLFLNAISGEDVYEIFQFAQGAFHKARVGDRAVAAQDLSEVWVVSRSDAYQRRDAAIRDFDAFIHWIEARTEGGAPLDDYYFTPTPAQMQAITEPFTLYFPPRRWFTFDSGGTVSWRNNGELAGLNGGGGGEFFRAMDTWVSEPATPVRLAYQGVSSATGGLSSSDGQNVILFGDPNSEIPNIDCASGGVLAFGGSWASSSGIFNGQAFLRIFEADMVVNNGIECLFQSATNPSRYIERLFAHEIGHTLGISHSSENPNEPNSTLRNALMYYRIASTDTRAVQLTSDDIAALKVLYRRVGSAPPPPPPAAGCPSGTPANTLCLLNGRFRVTGTWRNQFNDTSGTAIPIRNTNLSGFFYFTDPNNIELIMKILDFGTEIKVFYSQLTNLQFTLTVTDTATGRTKTYQNTPGDCGAIDPNFAALSALVSGDRLDALALPLAGSCVPSSSRLCLLDRRFAVTVDWRNQFNGVSGVGLARGLSNLTGAFAFDDPANLEILIKTLDFGDRVLVLYGSLSNFEYTIRVSDTVTGRVKDYRNAAGNYCGGIDQNAF